MLLLRCCRRRRRPYFPLYRLIGLGQQPRLLVLHLALFRSHLLLCGGKVTRAAVMRLIGGGRGGHWLLRNDPVLCAKPLSPPPLVTGTCAEAINLPLCVGHTSPPLPSPPPIVHGTCAEAGSHCVRTWASPPAPQMTAPEPYDCSGTMLRSAHPTQPHTWDMRCGRLPFREGLGIALRTML